MSRSRGFTLLELMITLAVLGVIMGLAVPAMGDFMVRQRVKSQANEVMLAVAAARSEAAKRNSSVAVIPAGAWSDGWCVVAVANALDCSSVDRLRSFDAVSDVTITSNFGTSANTRLEFNRYGACVNCDLAGAGNTKFFTVSSARLEDTRLDARCVQISRQGRPAIKSIKRDDNCD